LGPTKVIILLRYALSGTEGGMWELFVKDGEMRMYKLEREVNGVVVDPLKAVHSVKVSVQVK